VIVDFHTHIYKADPKYTGTSTKFGTARKQCTSEDMISLLDKNGINAAVAFMLGRLLTEQDFYERNKVVAEAARKYPDRIIGFVRVNPWMDNCVELIDKAVKEMGFKGLKLIPTAEAFPANDEIVFPLLEKAKQLGIPVQIHSHQPNSQPALIGDLADRFPDVTIVLAHFGMAAYADAIFVAKKCDNIILETSAEPWTHRILKGAIGRIGVDRIVWGSDAPLHHQEIELMKVRLAGLSDKELDMVLGRNAARILGLSGGN